MGERYTLPVLPLRDTVVYPGVAVPISAGRVGTVEAVQEALDGDRRLFAVAQRENVDEPDQEVLYKVGTVVRIIQTHRVRGGVQLLVQGEGRAQAVNYEKEGEHMLRAVLLEMERQGASTDEDPAFQALDRELRDRAAELGTRRGVPAEALNQLIQGVDDPGAFADLVAFYLELPTEDKQELLETLDDEERMRSALVAVERELARIDAQEDIQARVQTELGERQREMLLREQLKQIQKELGEGEDRDDLEEIKERIEAIDFADEQRSEVERELHRLERTSPQSAEYQVIRTFLEWVTELPWSERTEDKINLPRAEEILEEDHHGLEDVKDRVLEFLRCPEAPAGAGRGGRRGRRGTGGQPGRGAVPPGTPVLPGAILWVVPRRRASMPPCQRMATASAWTPLTSRRRGSPMRGLRRAFPTDRSWTEPLLEKKTGRRRRSGPWAADRSSCSSAPRGWGRPPSPSRSRVRSEESMCASRWVGHGMKPTSVATDAPTWVPCRGASSRACAKPR